MSESKRSIEYMPLEKIRGAEANPKEHADTVILQSVRRFGFAESPMLDDRTGRLVAGHGRIETLKALKMRGKKPPPGIELGHDGDWLVPVQRGWASRDDTEARAYVVTSNKSSEAGGWNDSLASELAAIADDSALALVGTGFDEHDLEKLTGEKPARAAGKKPRKDAVFQVLVEVEDETAQAKLIEKLEGDGFTCRPLLF